MELPVLILNAPVMTNDGCYTLETCSLKEAKELISSAPGIDSAVGHRATADVMTKLLEIPIPVNRYEAKQKTGQTALIFSLNSRIEEGKVLSSEDISEIGYQLKILNKPL